MNVKFNERKFRELVLYIAHRSIEDPRFGATKLNKLLCGADFFSYGQFDVPITGATYQRLEHGPAPRQYKPIERSLVDAGEAVVVAVKHYNRIQKRLFPLRDPDLSAFNANEIALVDELIKVWWELNATQISTFSHSEFLGWQVVEDQEDIPYETVFVSSEPPTPSDVKRAHEIAGQYGWLSST
jgi:hypothetical protein